MQPGQQVRVDMTMDPEEPPWKRLRKDVFTQTRDVEHGTQSVQTEENDSEGHDRSDYSRVEVAQGSAEQHERGADLSEVPDATGWPKGLKPSSDVVDILDWQDQGDGMY